MYNSCPHRVIFSPGQQGCSVKESDRAPIQVGSKDWSERDKFSTMALLLIGRVGCLLKDRGRRQA